MRLDDVRVLDLTRLLPGPYATQLLADLGADVIKIEDTGAGDYARDMRPTRGDGDSEVGAVFDAVNRGKRSAALDLKTDAGRRAFYDLAADADAVVESFRPGVVDRLGVDYGAVSEHNPDVVYCSLTGYGQTGPLADRPGHDLDYAARAGFLDMTRAAEGTAPPLPGYPIADLGGGLFAAFAVVSALLSRELGGSGGEYVDVSMTDVLASFGQTVAPAALDGEDPRPGETWLTGAAPWYGVYETADERYVALGALESQFWAAFCEAIDREDLVDYHGTEDSAERAALREELRAEFAARPLAAWRDLSAPTVEPVLTPAEAFSSDLAAAREWIADAGGRPRIGFPAVCDRPESDESLPGHGEHTAAVLREAGLGEERIERLRERGATL